MAQVQQQQKWRDVALEKSEVLTDAWEVSKAYMGRAADWVLFGCMILNILEIIPSIHMPSNVTGGVLAVQAVTLDVGGFALMSLAEHARNQGHEHAAKKADRTAWALVSIMIITLVLVASKTLYPDAGYISIANQIDNVLILVRIGMTVVYGKVIHSLRTGGNNALPVVVQDRLTVLLEEVQMRLRSEVQGVQDTVRREVQNLLAEHMQGVQKLLSEMSVPVQDTSMGGIQEMVQRVVHTAIQAQSIQLVERINEVQREVSTTRSVSMSTTESTGTHARATRGTVPPTIPVSGTIITEEDTTHEGYGTAHDTAMIPAVPVQQFILDQLAQSRIPTLSEIVAACKCSKTTASQERQKLLPTGEK